MDKDIKTHIINIMKSGTGGCKHQEMTQALNCSTCKMKMIRAQSEYNRLYKKYPEKFIIKEPDYPDSPQVQENLNMLEDREKRDSLYHKHIKLLTTGNPEKQRKEMKRFWNGFYEKHTGDYMRRTL